MEIFFNLNQRIERVYLAVIFAFINLNKKHDTKNYLINKEKL